MTDDEITSLVKEIARLSREAGSLQAEVDLLKAKIDKPIFSVDELDYIRRHISLAGESKMAKTIVQKTNEELLRNDK